MGQVSQKKKGAPDLNNMKKKSNEEKEQQKNKSVSKLEAIASIRKDRSFQRNYISV